VSCLSTDRARDWEESCGQRWTGHRNFTHGEKTADCNPGEKDQEGWLWKVQLELEGGDPWSVPRYNLKMANFLEKERLIEY
jgi:hypothetical protein